MTESEREQVRNVLLSITPEAAAAILDGEKRWEYRRVKPAARPPYRLVLYATAPRQAAIGACWVPFVRTGRPATVVLETIDDTPHDTDAIMTYFTDTTEAHALRVVGPRRFDTPVGRSSLEAVGTPPAQNFRYLPDVNPAYAETQEVTI